MQPTPPNPPQKPTGEPPAPPDDLPLTSLDLSPRSYYQAIGWLKGRILLIEERFFVQIRDVNFPLYMQRRVTTAAKKLEGQMAWLKCYPQSKGEGLSFRAVWIGLEKREEADAGIFVLRGVWQFIPQCRRPVFSVYRNELKDYESRPSNQHLPLIWSDQPPYRFRKDSEERPKFYQITARLIPQRNCFGFVAQIAEPSEETPKRVKKTPPEGPPGKKGKFEKGEKEVKEAKESPVSLETSPVAEKGVPEAEGKETQTVSGVVQEATGDKPELDSVTVDLAPMPEVPSPEVVTEPVPEGVVEPGATPGATPEATKETEALSSPTEETIESAPPKATRKKTTRKKKA